MSAHLAFSAPIGSILTWSDGTPRPPERHRKKLSRWKTNNSSGRLIRRQDEHPVGRTIHPASFTLHEGDHGAGGVIAIRTFRTFSVDTVLTFTLAKRPAIGSCRVYDRDGGNAELVHLAENREAAQTWLKVHGYPQAIIKDVPDSEADSPHDKAA